MEPQFKAEIRCFELAVILANNILYRCTSFKIVSSVNILVLPRSKPKSELESMPISKFKYDLIVKKNKVVKRCSMLSFFGTFTSKRTISIMGDLFAEHS